MPPSASSLLVGRRFCCASGSSPRGKKGLEDNVFSKKRLVFVGSPQLAAIVTQPPSARLRGRRKLPSPVAEHALDSGFPHHLIFTPEKAGEVRSEESWMSFDQEALVLHNKLARYPSQNSSG